MSGEYNKQLNRKIMIKADIEVLTGMHIGGSDAYSAIGTVDSPVIRSSRDNRPIIPGSSLKGKLRTLLAAVKDTPSEYNDPKTDKLCIKRLFGATGENKNDRIIPSRLQFADCYIKNDNNKNLSELTEVKFENTINRGTCVANPRQIERVAPGVVFEAVMIYQETAPEETKEDLSTLAEGMKLLQYDYLGGHGTRGYGRISFKNICIKTVYPEEKEEKELAEIFGKVEKDEILCL